MEPHHFFIGTSGWSFKGWSEEFYPQGTHAKDWLAFNAKSFSTVELNSSFYPLPNAKSISNWYRETPQSFIFSCKASRYLTHVKNLTNPMKYSYTKSA